MLSYCMLPGNYIPRGTAYCGGPRAPIQYKYREKEKP